MDFWQAPSFRHGTKWPWWSSLSSFFGSDQWKSQGLEFKSAPTRQHNIINNKYDNLIDCHCPWFCVKTTFYDGHVTISNGRASIIHLLSCRRSYEFSVHSNFLGPSTLKVKCKANLECLQLLDQAQNMNILSLRPSSSNVKQRLFDKNLSVSSSRIAVRICYM